ncbi:MAG TPA: zinc ribbon domain-containing protein [Terriglobales bacterium]|nr:zinc ribbon domain-containing protein [Terriglobales bacterium]
MPIFEYLCGECGHKFEAIVMGEQKAECPKCHTAKLEQQLSRFSAHAHSGAPAPSPCGRSSCCMNDSGGCSMN